MDRLPRVLQNEIWEYVRGDRTFWKTKHKLVIDHIQKLISKKQYMDNTEESEAWVNRGLICWVAYEHGEIEHADHIHVKHMLYLWAHLQCESVKFRRKHIKNPKFHAEDLSFLTQKRRGLT
jgi:hypothetical protein